MIPVAGIIEAAVDNLKQMNEHSTANQLKELHVAVGDKSQDFQDGYQLGLATARVMIANNSALIVHGIKVEDIL